MAIRDFVFPHSPLLAAELAAAKVPVKSKLSARTVSINSGKAKPVRTVKGLPQMPPSPKWYEAEDRTLPSVSSF